ncbi:MAG TPA: single-stranded DNA-binding protein [Propionibacteriaceae bacterium]
MSINITVNGRLTRDPALRQTQSGKQVFSFGLAHNFRERVSGQMRDVTTVFFDASVWEEDGAVEVAELGLAKGSRVTVPLTRGARTQHRTRQWPRTKFSLRSQHRPPGRLRAG